MMKTVNGGVAMAKAKALYLVTGAMGHLGSAVVRLLREKGCAVRGLAVEAERALAEKADIDIVYGDIRDKDSVRPLFCDSKDQQLIVIHTAGIVSIASRFNQAVCDVNVRGTQNIVELCEEYGADKLVYVSSVHAIPEPAHGELIVEVDRFDPALVRGLYAKTKAEATQIVLEAAKRGLNASVVHPSGIIGPYDAGHGHLTQLILDYVDGRLSACVSGGYDFVDVRDVARCIVECAQKGGKGECYICSNQYLTVPRLMQYLHEITGLKKVRVVLPMFLAKLTAPLAEFYYKLHRQPPLFTSYSLYTLTSNSNFSHVKADRELGAERLPVRQTLEDTVNWLKTNGRFRPLRRRRRQLLRNPQLFQL